MTDAQIKLARRALGLPNKSMKPAKNICIVDYGHSSYLGWIRMAFLGHAKRFDGSDMSLDKAITGCDIFCLTADSAQAALSDGETLDLETFTLMSRDIEEWATKQTHT